MINSIDIYIYTSNRCNLKCKYCYVDDSSISYISQSSIDKIIDFIFSDQYIINREKINIKFIGGEPLLEIDIIESITDKFIDRVIGTKWENNFTFGFNTNGTLLESEESRAFINKYPFFKYGISIDGPEEVHNKNRVYKNGNGTFSNTIIGLSILPKDRTFIDSVISKNNIGDLYSILRFQLKESSNNCIGVILDNGIYYTKEDAKTIYKQMDKLINLLIDNNMELYTGVFGAIRINSDIRTSYIPDYKCGFGRSVISIHPNGDIHPCQSVASNNCDKLIIGNIENGIDTDKMNNILEKVKESFCQRCRLNYMCDRCISQLYDKENDTFSKANNICYITKIKYLLARRFYNRVLEQAKQTVKFIGG